MLFRSTPINSRYIAPYMLHTARENDVIILKLYHRYEDNYGNMKFFGMPQLITIGTWATCEQIINEISKQLEKFVESNNTKYSRKIQIIDGSNYDIQSVPDAFRIYLIDMTNETCAICNSKSISMSKRSNSIKRKECKGCNLINYRGTPIKTLVNHFGNVVICLDWINKENYKEPKILSNISEPKDTLPNPT